MKKQFMNRILSIIIAMSIIMGLMPFSVVAAGTVDVGNISELKSALADSSNQVIRITSDITYTSATDPGLALNHNVTIMGQGKKIQLGSHSITLSTVNGTLEVHDLKMENTNVNGFFSAYASSVANAGIWDIVLYSTAFNGTSLLGQRNAGSIKSVTFKEATVINAVGTAAGDAVVYATNVIIDTPDFSMTGFNNSIFFKSVNSSGIGNGVNAYGKFIVSAGASANLKRNLSSTTANTFTKNLIEGYESYYFGENSVFSGIAGTNVSESNKCYNQTAIIHSGSAKEFIVEKGANVSLTSDYSLTNYLASHGSTALSLRKPKEGVLNITIAESANLSVNAYGTNSIARDFAPVLIGSEVTSGNSGTSNVLVKGTLNVNSKNGNGWYYQYIDYSTLGQDNFTVDGGTVNIIANGKEGRAQMNAEYAALEHYGPVSFDVKVINAGKMAIKSNGWRAMSLAGGILPGLTPNKTITVTGEGSDLVIEGGQFAIAAEGKTNFKLNVLEGGHVSTWNTQDSNIYTTGQATYCVDGDGSRLEMQRTGKPESTSINDSTSLYGVIFHDAPLVGPLTINVTNGGYMSAINNNGSRAAITTQSNYITTHSINVNGADSTLAVINKNTNESAAGDNSLYPVGAISFAANCSGNINIKNGGNFFAESYSYDSPTIALGSYAGTNYSGVLTLDNPGSVDIKNNANTKNKRAVALRGRNYDPNVTSKDSITALNVKNSDITVWPVGFGAQGWPNADIISIWEDFNAIVPNKDTKTVQKDTLYGHTDITLSIYGRIAAKGANTPPTPPLPPEPPIIEPIEKLVWMRSSEEVSSNFVVPIPTNGDAWGYNTAVSQTPLNYFENESIRQRAESKASNGEEWLADENKRAVGEVYVWDKGTYFDQYKSENGNVGFDWASWRHTGQNASKDQSEGEYSIRRFSTYVSVSQNTYDNIEDALLATSDELGNMSYLFPINDSVFVFVNGQLAFWGGTDVAKGQNQYEAIFRENFAGKAGIALRNGMNGIFKSLYPHTDGWCIDLEKDKDAVDIKGLIHPGENRIDIFADDYWEGGGMNKLDLYFNLK